MVRTYQTLNLLAIFCGLFKKKTLNNNSWNYFSIASWVYYLCGIIATILPLGIIATIEEGDISAEDFAICLIFFVTCVISNCVMVIQKVWRIKYNDEIVVFRNSFGIVRKYKIKELRLSENDRLCKILYNGKRIIQWDTLIMNVSEEVDVCRTIFKLTQM